MEKHICLICLENIENEFCILNCNCKTSIYHNKCINELINFNIKEHIRIRCPQCRYIFKTKPRLNIKYAIDSNTGNEINVQVFAVNYNILRIMSGMGSISYSN